MLGARCAQYSVCSRLPRHGFFNIVSAFAALASCQLPPSSSSSSSTSSCLPLRLLHSFGRSRFCCSICWASCCLRCKSIHLHLATYKCLSVDVGQDRSTCNMDGCNNNGNSNLRRRDFCAALMVVIACHQNHNKLIRLTEEEEREQEEEQEELSRAGSKHSTALIGLQWPTSLALLHVPHRINNQKLLQEPVASC